MPLYACEHCGFTSAAFRLDAVSAHRLEYPECEGVMRIVFRSEDRDRGHPYASGPARRSVRPTRDPGQDLPAAGGRGFELRERVEADGTLRLTLRGDLDLPVTGTLSARLEELKTEGRPVRLDLSQLTFIDSSGLQALIVALIDARSTGWPLEVAPEVSPSVQRAAQVVGIAQVLWPHERPRPGSDAAQSAAPPHELA
ncbi:MAG TPA: STAS domain-containing protein [Solirubrobacteraceae bacterium]|nr:STAS domain-containing protein [Solirubrobacteraceae bacterium]